MTNPMLSTKTEKEIQKFVQNISLNAGVISTDNRTYVEEIKFNLHNAKQEMKQNVEQFKVDTKDFLAKLRVSSIQNDEFQEEIQTHIKDHVNELVAGGMTEEEALKIVLTEFEDIDFSELNDKKGDSQMMTKADERLYEAIGVFYAGFLFLGGAVGFLIGSWKGAILGVIMGVGLGLISHGITAVLNREK